MPACSVSTSFASFEAELEGAILHHTGAIDYYLETAAPKWADTGTQEHATPQKLHMMYVADMTSNFWQAVTYGRGEISVFDDGPLSMAHAHRPAHVPPRESFNASQMLRHSKRRPRTVPMQVGESRLDQYLQQDLQRYMDGMREQLESEASESEAAMLSTNTRHSRSSSSSSSGGGSGSFVRLPDADQLLEDDTPADDALAPAAAAAAAAAAAMAAVNDMLLSERSSAAVLGCAPQVAAVQPGFSPAATVAEAEALQATSGAVGEPVTDAGIAVAADLSGVPASPQPTAVQAAPTALHHPPLPAAAATAAAVVAAEAATPGEALVAAPAAPAAAAAASVPPFTMERDEDIAAQKLVARMRLAELQEAAAAGSGTAAATPAAPAKAATRENSSAVAGHKGCGGSDGLFDSPAGTGAGGLHHSRIPSRPSGLAGMHAGAGASRYVQGDPLGYGPRAIMQQYRFFQTLLLGLLCCMAVLPVFWALQAYSAQDDKPSVPLHLFHKLQTAASYLYLPGAAALLVYLLRSVVMLRPPLLHFPDPTLEQRYLFWSNSGKLFLDSMFQVLLLVVGSCLWLRLKHGSVMGDDLAVRYTRTLLAIVSMMGSGLPVVLLLLLRSVRYLEWREQLLAGSRVLSIIALSVMQMTLPADCTMQLPLSMPFVAVAQLIGIACMQVRLATFVPCQVLHLLVLLWKTQAPNPLLHIAQLFGGGLFLPCLLLYSMELHSRKAFVSTVIGRKKTV